MTLEEYETLRRNYIQGMKKKNKNDARQMIRAANNASELQKKLAVRKKLKEVEKKDHIRNFQPPIDGLEIMKIFNIQQGRNIGILKTAISQRSGSGGN